MININLLNEPIFYHNLCSGGDLNSQALRHTHLKRACLPISTPEHLKLKYNLNKIKTQSKAPPSDGGAFDFIYLTSSTASTSFSSITSGTTSFTLRICFIFLRTSLAALSRILYNLARRVLDFRTTSIFSILGE